jgi:lipid II:glycine glycyltransferase (peptidoglycan interpeptide bridge formation enzyme)
LVEIVDEEHGNLVAGALFLLDETGWVHYHLSAATPSAMKLQGMELLMASALHRYGNSGCVNMHLGGGHALDESDGLSRFKSKFSTERMDFYCTKLVCDAGRYQCERAKLPLNNPEYFLIADARGQ